MSISKFLVAVAALICVPAMASADINYNEAVSGDLGEAATPTNLGTLDLGVNSVTGTLTNPASFDPDAFSFTVDVGQELSALFFSSLTGSGHFFALSNLNTVLDTGSGGGNRYASLVASSDAGTNILDGNINSFGGSGGSGPLGAGEYSFWLQELNPVTVEYSISLTTVSTVPEPCSATALMLSGGIMLLRRRRKTIA